MSTLTQAATTDRDMTAAAGILRALSHLGEGEHLDWSERVAATLEAARTALRLRHYCEASRCAAHALHLARMAESTAAEIAAA